MGRGRKGGWKVAPVTSAVAFQRAGQDAQGGREDDKVALLQRLASTNRLNDDGEVQETFDNSKGLNWVEGEDKLFHCPETKGSIGFSHVRIFVFYATLFGLLAASVYIVVCTSTTRGVLGRYDFPYKVEQTLTISMEPERLCLEKTSSIIRSTSTSTPPPPPPPPPLSVPLSAAAVPYLYQDIVVLHELIRQNYKALDNADGLFYHFVEANSFINPTSNRTEILNTYPSDLGPGDTSLWLWTRQPFVATTQMTFWTLLTAGFFSPVLKHVEVIRKYDDGCNRAGVVVLPRNTIDAYSTAYSQREKGALFFTCGDGCSFEWSTHDVRNIQPIEVNGNIDLVMRSYRWHDDQALLQALIFSFILTLVICIRILPKAYVHAVDHLQLKRFELKTKMDKLHSVGSLSLGNGKWIQYIPASMLPPTPYFVVRKQETQGHKARSQKKRLAGHAHHHQEDEMRQRARAIVPMKEMLNADDRYGTAYCYRLIMDGYKTSMTYREREHAKHFTVPENQRILSRWPAYVIRNSYDEIATFHSISMGASEDHNRSSLMRRVKEDGAMLDVERAVQDSFFLVRRLPRRTQDVSLATLRQDKELLRSILLIQRAWRTKQAIKRLAGAEKALTPGQQQVRQLNSLRIKLDVEAQRASTAVPWHEISPFESIVVWAEQAISIILAEGMVSSSDVRKSRVELQTFLTEGLVKIKANVEDQLKRENKIWCELNDVVDESLPEIRLHRRTISAKWKLHKTFNGAHSEAEVVHGDVTFGDIEEGKRSPHHSSAALKTGSRGFWYYWDTFWLLVVIAYHYSTSLRLQNAFFDEFHNLVHGYTERLSSQHPILVRVLSQQCVQNIIKQTQEPDGSQGNEVDDENEEKMRAERSLLVFNHLVILRTLQFVLDFVEAQSWGDSPAEKRSALAKIVKRLAEMAAENREDGIADQMKMRQRRRDKKKRASMFTIIDDDADGNDSESIDQSRESDERGATAFTDARRRWGMLRGIVLFIRWRRDFGRAAVDGIKKHAVDQLNIAKGIAVREGFREASSALGRSSLVEKLTGGTGATDDAELKGVKIDADMSEGDLFAEMSQLRREGRYRQQDEADREEGEGEGGLTLPGETSCTAETDEDGDGYEAMNDQDGDHQEMIPPEEQSGSPAEKEAPATDQSEEDGVKSAEEGAQRLGDEKIETEEAEDDEDENDDGDGLVETTGSPSDAGVAVSSEGDGIFEALSLSNILRVARLSNLIYSWVLLQSLVTVLQVIIIFVMVTPPIIISVGLMELVQAPWYIYFAPMVFSGVFLLLACVDFYRYNTRAVYASEYSLKQRAANNARRTVDTTLMDRQWAIQQREWIARREGMRRQSKLGIASMRDTLHTLGEEFCLRQTAEYFRRKRLGQAFKAFVSARSERERRLNCQQRQYFLLKIAFKMLALNMKRGSVGCGSGVSGAPTPEESGVQALRSRIMVIPAFRKWRRMVKDHRARTNLRRERTLAARTRKLTWLMLAALLSLDLIVIVLMIFWTIIGTIAQLGRSAAVLTLLFTACFIFFRKWARNSKKRKELMKEVREKLKAKMDAAKEYKESFSTHGKFGKSRKNVKLRILDPVVWRKRQVSRVLNKITDMAASMSRTLGSSISKDDLSALFSKDLVTALDTALLPFHAAISTPRLEALLKKVGAVLASNTKLPADLSAWKTEGWQKGVSRSFEPLHIDRIVDDIRKNANWERDRLVKVQMRFNALTFFEEPQNHSIIASKVYLKIAKRNKRNIWSGILKALTFICGAGTLYYGLEAVSIPGASAKLLQGMFLLLFSGAALAETGGGMEMGGDVDGAVDESFNEEVEGGDDGGEEGEGEDEDEGEDEEDEDEDDEEGKKGKKKREQGDFDQDGEETGQLTLEITKMIATKLGIDISSKVDTDDLDDVQDLQEIQDEVKAGSPDVMAGAAKQVPPPVGGPVVQTIQGAKLLPGSRSTPAGSLTGDQLLKRVVASSSGAVPESGAASEAAAAASLKKATLQDLASPPANAPLSGKQGEEKKQL